MRIPLACKIRILLDAEIAAIVPVITLVLAATVDPTSAVTDAAPSSIVCLPAFQACSRPSQLAAQRLLSVMLGTAAVAVAVNVIFVIVVIVIIVVAVIVMLWAIVVAVNIVAVMGLVVA